MGDSLPNLVDPTLSTSSRPDMEMTPMSAITPSMAMAEGEKPVIVNIADSVEAKSRSFSQPFDVSKSPSQGTTTVLTTFWINDLCDIDSADQSFAMDADVDFCWKIDDTRLIERDESKDPTSVYAYKLADGLKWEDVWRPNVQIINMNGGHPETEPIFMIKTMGGVGHPSYVSMEVTYVVNLTCCMNLAHFPYDQQLLSLILRDATNNIRDVVFKPAVPKIEQDARHLISKELDLTGFSLDACRLKTSDHQYINLIDTEGLENSTYSQVQIDVNVSRQAGYYLRKIVVPMVLLCLMELGVFLVHPEDFSTRSSITVTLLLTVVAFQFIIGSDLPRVGYLTFMDYLFLLYYLLFAATYLESLVLACALKERPVSFAPLGEHVDRVDLISGCIYGGALLFSTLTFLAFPYLMRACRCRPSSTSSTAPATRTRHHKTKISLDLPPLHQRGSSSMLKTFVKSKEL